MRRVVQKFRGTHFKEKEKNKEYEH
jgi:hypothetical protein